MVKTSDLKPHDAVHDDPGDARARAERVRGASRAELPRRRTATMFLAANMQTLGRRREEYRHLAEAPIGSVPAPHQYPAGVVQASVVLEEGWRIWMFKHRRDRESFVASYPQARRIYGTKSKLPRVCALCHRNTHAPLFDGCMDAECPYGFTPCM